jgi:copper chaperone CopZ
MTEQQTTTYAIDGMTCAHCVMSVDERSANSPA